MSRDRIDALNAALAGRYRIERELGQGGMAHVYLARDEKHGRPIAIKVMRSELGAAAGSDRFRREIEVAAQLNHPNILALHDSGDADGALYFIMPFVEGESLRDRLEREGRLNLEEASRIVREVGGALEYAHGRGLIHRDIKPENILFQAGHAVVCDFGIAKVANEARDRMTRTGTSVGTLAYMSPEQLSEGGQVDARADVYALGSMLYEMLAGEPPYAASTAQATLAKKLMGERPDGLDTLDVPASVREVIEQSIAASADSRFASAADFVSALDLSTTTLEIERVERLQRRTRRNRAAAVGVGIALLGAAGWWFNNAMSGPLVETVAVVPVLTGDSIQDFLIRDVSRDLTRELGRVGVRVKSDGAVKPYLEDDLTPIEIGSELDVDGVIRVEATLVAEIIESDLQLVDPRTQDILWVRGFSGEERRLRSILGEMTLQVAPVVGGQIGDEDRARYEAATETDPFVLEALQRADFYWEQLTEESLESALAYYELARDRDPTSGEAWNGIAQTWLIRAQQDLAPPAVARAMAEPALDSALKYDPEIPEVYQTIAVRKTWAEWDWDGAREAFERALELDPSDATTRAYYGLFLLYQGDQDRWSIEAERAVNDDPPNGLIRGLYAQGLNSVGRSEDALVQLEEALRFGNNVPYLLATLRTTYHLLDDYDAAIESWRASFTSEGTYEADNASDTEALAVLANYTGGAESYRSALYDLAELFVDRLNQDPPSGSAWRVGTAFARAGAADEAIRYLDRAVEEGSQNSPSLSVEDIFDFMRDDPRFQALIRRLDLPLKVLATD